MLVVGVLQGDSRGIADAILRVLGGFRGRERGGVGVLVGDSGRGV